MKNRLKLLFKVLLKPFFRFFDTMQIINGNNHVGVGDKFGYNFKDYFYINKMEQIEHGLTLGLDSHSKEIVLRKIDIFKNIPLWDTVYSKNIRTINRDEILYNDEELNEAKKIKKQLPKIKKSIDFKNYLCEVVYYHHGLTLLDWKALNFLSNKIFIDCGASFGDSAVIFSKYYNPEKVISFELTNDAKKAEQDYFKTLISNQIDLKKIEFVPEGVSDKKYNLDGKDLKLTTIDDFVKRNNLDKIGLIKMDIEGAAKLAVLGALNTIKNYRPILVISIYHTPEEFFEIKPLIEKLDIKYKFMIKNLNPIDYFEHETILLCVPKELS